MGTTFTDITTTGRLSSKDLQDEINSPFKPNTITPTPRISIPRQLDYMYEGPEQSPILLQGNGEYLGSSRYDINNINPSEWRQMQENPNEFRAQNQPWYAKLGAGVTKGVILAGTTAIDGTLGLIYGIGQGIIEGRVSALFDNDVSNALHAVNQLSEEALSNYRTAEERDRMWYQNLGTINFWADSFLKNMGFTVGAMLSGAAWTAPLKALKVGTMAARVVGSTMQGVNEGRVEANNLYHENLEAANKALEASYSDRISGILNAPISYDEKQALLRDTDNNYRQALDINRQQALNAGLVDLAVNSVLLPASDFITWGRLYTRGYTNAARAGMRGRTKQGVGEVIQGEERRLGTVANKGGLYEVVKDNPTLRGAAKGIGKGLVEMNEEMWQEMSAQTSTNIYMPDSPDAYYNALLDPKALEVANDFWKSAGEGFINSYGSGEQWEQGFIGFLTGALGMPTFGSMNNMSQDVAIGRGKPVALSGGILGEIRQARYEQQQAEKYVPLMNNLVEKVRKNRNYLAQSNAFQDAMDGYVQEKDQFEYQNASDNDIFAGISAFAQTGRMNDLKELFNEDFENMDREELKKLAVYTSKNPVIDEEGNVLRTNIEGNTLVGPYVNDDGTLYTDSEEGTEAMRKSLIKQRDELLQKVSQYEQSQATVRALGHDALSEDQVNELAWLNWKINVFNDRYESLKKDNAWELGVIKKDLASLRASLSENTEDLDERAAKVKKHMEIIEDYADALLKSKSAIHLGRFVAANPKIQEALEDLYIDSYVSLSYDTFVHTMTNLQDIAKISKVAVQFNDRYKEFSENPSKLVKNRQKISNKLKKASEALSREKERNRLKETSVSDMIEANDLGDMSLDELKKQFSDDPVITTTINSAKAVIRDSKRVSDIINNDLTILDDQARSDALTLLNNSRSVASDEQELLDLEREAFNDPNILIAEDSSLQELPSAEEIRREVNARTDKAKNVLSYAIDRLRQEKNDIAETQAASSPKKTPKATEKGETGHDAVDRVEALNDKKPEVPTQDPLDLTVDFLMAKIEKDFSIPGDIRNAFIEKLYDIVKQVDTLKKAGNTSNDVYNTVSNSPAAKALSTWYPGIQAIITPYILGLYRDTSSTSSSTSQEEFPEVPTPQITDDDINGAVPQDDTKESDTKGYWKPALTYLPVRRAKGEFKPFYAVVRDTPNLYPSQRQRIIAVGEELENNGAFSRVRNGGVQAGDKIFFTVKRELNDRAGEIVILMTDDQDNIVGDVMSLNDNRIKDYPNLKAFIARVEKEYKDADSPTSFRSKETTTVDKVMVGKVPYTSNDVPRRSLNEIHTTQNGNPVEFKLGIAMADGPQARILATPSRTDRSPSDFEKTIKPPLKAKNGQPFLLMPTADKKGRNQYITVPFIIPTFDSISTDSTLYKKVEEAVSKLKTGNNKTAPNIKQDIMDLLAIPDLHINYDGDTVELHIGKTSQGNRVRIYKGSKNHENLVSSIMYSFQVHKVTVQVSRKYINTSYDGISYNRMIGEIALTNLNSTHTIDDYFTLNPLDTNGKVMKASSPKSIGVNPNAVSKDKVEISSNSYVDLGTNEVFFNGKLYEGKDKNNALAYAFGVQSKQNMDEPYETSWGYFNPVTRQFIKRPEIIIRTLGGELVDKKSSNPVIEKDVKKGRPAEITLSQHSGKLRDTIKEALTKIIKKPR